MAFVGANDHPDPDRLEDPLNYAPRSVRMADPRFNATPHTRSDPLPPTPPLSRFDGMREEAFAKFARPLEAQFVYERRPRRVLLATAAGIVTAIGAAAIVALVFLNVVPKSESGSSELAVSISTPASATPAEAVSEDSQALLQRFTQFQKIQGSVKLDDAASELTPAGTVKEGPEKPQALLEKFIQWEQKK